MNVCIIGNSQAACLKAAWDVPENRPPGQAVTFFAAFGMSLRNLALQGGRLVPTKDTLRRNLFYTAGVGEIDLAAFDVFLVCGVGLGLRPLDARLSSQAVRALCADIMRSSLAYSIVKKIRDGSHRPIYLMHSPLLDERRARDREVLAYRDYVGWLEEALDVPGAHLLRQPEETITRAHYTRIEFSQDAARLALNQKTEGVQHKENDYNHMNARYGAVRLKDFFERVAAPPPARR
ncbi:MAG: hypothetical protein IAE95_10050 [Chitinophagaceae bacterium]|nr:hypothetical protein [Chitinophagaceae bacterium]